MSECNCWRCREELGETLNVFIVCQDCGNKRCPKANDHRNTCTGSNDVGQPGSAYEHGSGAATARRFYDPDLTDEERDAFVRAIEEQQ